MLTDAGLRRLFALKLRGALRKQVRRVRTLAGAVLFLLGLLLLTLWIGSLAIGYGGRGEVEIAAHLRAPLARLLITMMALVTLASSLTHRGLYLPGEEIERLFSAPVSRADLIRYRLLVASGRSLFGALILALLVQSRTPVGLYGFVGALLTMLTLPVAAQALSILAGDAENRLLRRLPGRALRLAIVGSALAAWLLVMFLFFGAEDAAGTLSQLGVEDGLEGILALAPVRWCTAPAAPWARMIMAADGLAFARWGAFCALAWVVLFEFTARLRVDFRELSLTTSADVARRLVRARQGGIGASASEASKRTIGWRIPWLFGRGPGGAIAWRKTVGILRKARGTAFTSVAIIAFLTLLTSAVASGSEPEQVLGGAAFLVGLGTLYLGGGLRFDFRDELEHMELVKAWPVRPWKVFLATILPQVVLVSVLLVAALAVRSALTATFHPLLVAFAAGIPLVTLTWVALDNIVFLFLPVRYLPGQDGALQHSGRMVVTLFLRLVLLMAAAFLVSVVVALTLWVGNDLGLARSSVVTVATFFGALVLACVAGALVAVGGRVLTRFDVARDRG